MTDGTVGGGVLTIGWIALVSSSLFAGLFLVTLMIVPRRAIPPVLFMLVCNLIVSSGSLILLGIREQRVDLAFATALLGFFLLALSYSVTAILLPHLLRAGRSPAHGAAPNSSSEVTVILNASLEPETYHPRDVAHTLLELEQTGVPLPAATARPMLYAAERARYRAGGSQSPARGVARELADALARQLGDEAEPGDVRLAWCGRTPRLDQVVAQAAQGGAGRIVVVDLVVADSLRTDKAHRSVDGLDLDGQSVEVAYTAPLWGSTRITEMVFRKLETAMADLARDRVGVVLVGHGQPPAWESDHPSWTEQETYFQQRLRVRLHESGVPERNIRLAWLDWTEPDVTDGVRHLTALGCESVFVIPSVMPVETLGTLVDLRQSVRLARVSPTSNVIVLEPWGLEDDVVLELADRVRETVAEMRA